MNFSSDWTEMEDRVLKEFHECNWEESCVMCKEYWDCIESRKEER